MYETEDGNHDLFMDVNEEIRFRVIDEIFLDTTPNNAPTSNTEQIVEKNAKAPYTLKVNYFTKCLFLLNQVLFLGFDFRVWLGFIILVE